MSDKQKEPNKRQELVDAVIEQITEDIASKDVTALDALLQSVPNRYLLAYLPEAQHAHFKLGE
jgi:hypothetical protein